MIINSNSNPHAGWKFLCYRIWRWKGLAQTGSNWFTDAVPRLAKNICVYKKIMMMSSNGNIFCVTGPLWGEFTGHRWMPLTKASDEELWCFPWSAGDLRRHGAHYDVTLMMTASTRINNQLDAWNVQCLCDAIVVIYVRAFRFHDGVWIGNLDYAVRNMFS